MNFLYPKIPREKLALMAAITAAGGVVGILYGIVHDQITYTIGPEYFTKLKFAQFAWANVGLPPRLFAGEIGAIAVGWVGACAAWLLARFAVPEWTRREAIRICAVGFLIILGFAFAGGLTGFLLGLVRADDPDFSHWEDLLGFLDIRHRAAFVHVAYIHNASYAGGLAGLIVAMAWLLRQRAIHRKTRPLRCEN